MIDPKTLEEEPINMVELKNQLQKIKKRDGELNFRSNKALDYLNQFVTLKLTESRELYKKLQALEIPRLKENHMNKLVDLLPATEEEIAVVLQGYTLTVSKENIGKILKVLKEYQ